MTIQRICHRYGLRGWSDHGGDRDRAQVQVQVVDINQARIDAWNDADLGKLPVYEPGLDRVVGRARGRTCISPDVAASIAAADMVFISVNTPTKTKGLEQVNQ